MYLIDALNIAAGLKVNGEAGGVPRKPTKEDEVLAQRVHSYDVLGLYL